MLAAAGRAVRRRRPHRASRCWPPSPGSSCSALLLFVLQQTLRHGRELDAAARRTRPAGAAETADRRCWQAARRRGGRVRRRRRRAATLDRRAAGRARTRGRRAAGASRRLEQTVDWTTRRARADAGAATALTARRTDSSGSAGEPPTARRRLRGRCTPTGDGRRRSPRPTRAVAPSTAGRPSELPAAQRRRASAGRCSPTTCSRSSWPARCCWSPPSGPSPSPAAGREGLPHDRRCCTTTSPSAPSCSPSGWSGS